MRIFRRVIVAFLVFCLIVSFCGCTSKSDETLIRERMETFEKAYNAGDMEKVLNCFDARTRNTYKAILNIGNSLIGKTGVSIDISDMFSLGIALMDEDDVLEFGDMDIVIRSESSAVVTVTMEYGAESEKSEETVTFSMVKEEDDWYITG